VVTRDHVWSFAMARAAASLVRARHPRLSVWSLARDGAGRDFRSRARQWVASSPRVLRLRARRRHSTSCRRSVTGDHRWSRGITYGHSHAMMRVAIWLAPRSQWMASSPRVLRLRARRPRAGLMHTYIASPGITGGHAGSRMVICSRWRGSRFRSRGFATGDFVAAAWRARTRDLALT